jgi:cysteine desulfurase
LGCRHIITSKIEHHATLHAVQHLAKEQDIKLSYTELLQNGHINLHDLERLLKESNDKCLVTFLHANNEIGNMLDIQSIGNLCRTYQAIFHCDTVQTVGHIPFDLGNTPVDFITGAGHKFHGPKGVGILYINEKLKIQPLIFGGSQERNMRAGTENLYGIVGFAKALELATINHKKDSAFIQGLKSYMIEQLQQKIAGVEFNGDINGSSLYTVLNVSLPKTDKSEMLLFNLDINHICASGGSACSSGADAGSHVINEIKGKKDQVAVRFSFSKYNTIEEIDTVVKILTSCI